MTVNLRRPEKVPNVGTTERPDDIAGGYRYGSNTLIDSLVVDGLWDPYGNYHMGKSPAPKPFRNYHMVPPPRPSTLKIPHVYLPKAQTLGDYHMGNP